MIKLKKVFAGAMVAAMMFSAVGCGMIEKTEEGVKNTVVAKVYGEKITLGQVDETLSGVMTKITEQYGENYKENEQVMEYLVNQRKQVLETLVDDVIVAKKANELGIMPSDEELDQKVSDKLAEVKSSFGDDATYQSALTSAGITEEQLSKELRISVIQQIVYDKIGEEVEVTDDQIQEYYNNNQTSFTESPNTANISHILVASEDEAKEVIARLDNGEDFAEVAKEVSTDTTSAVNGGELGDIKYTDTSIDHTFLTAAIALDKGTYTESPVNTQFGYHVIKLNDKQEYPVKPLDEVKESIKSQLLEQAKYDKWNEQLAAWKDEAKPKTYEDKLNQ